MDRDSELLIAYLRSQSPGAFVPWISPQFESGTPWSTQGVDVRIVDEEAPAPRWAWTIVGPDQVDELDPEELWCFAWPPDVDVHEVWETPLPPHTAQQFVLEVALSRDNEPTELSPSQQGLVVHPGWTSDAVSAALMNWATVHAGRDDLHFFWDDIVGSLAFAAVEHSDSPLLRYLHDAIEEDAESSSILRRILHNL